MKPNAIIAAVMLATLLAGESAYAQRYERQRQDRDFDARGRAEQGRRDDLGQRATRSNNGPLQTALPDEGAGPGRNIRVGDQLPRQYFNSNYAVEDWAAHGLAQPAGSGKWFQVGADYVQVNLWNGIVGWVVVAR